MILTSRDKAVLIAARRLASFATVKQLAKYLHGSGVTMNIGQVYASLDLLETFKLVQMHEFVSAQCSTWCITMAGSKMLHDSGLVYVSDVVERVVRLPRAY
jgi:hypothetical protein